MSYQVSIYGGDAVGVVESFDEAIDLASTCDVSGAPDAPEGERICQEETHAAVTYRRGDGGAIVVLVTDEVADENEIPEGDI